MFNHVTCGCYHPRMLRTVAALLLLLAPLSVGQRTADGGLARRVRSLFATLPRDATWAAVVRDGATGADLVSVRGDLLLVPASNMKIVIAGGVLLGLGPDHRIFTDLVAHGDRRGGVLEGTLRLRGEGDPTLKAAPLLPQLAKRMRAEGITGVSGDLLVDDRLFDREFCAPGWPSGPGNPPWKPYLAEVCALSLDHGTVLLRVSSGRRPVVKVIPADCGVIVENRLTRTDNPKHHLIHVARSAGGKRLVVSGRVLAGARTQDVRVAVHDPGVVFGGALVAELKRQGIRFDGVVRRPREGELSRGGHRIARWSTPVQDILPHLLKASQNHRTDMLLKHLGAVKSGVGTFVAGARELRRLFPGLARAALVDGSGLSYDNRISARMITGCLLAVDGAPIGSVFRDALPYGGEPGSTLRARLKKVGRRVRAKTGSLRIASALSGFVTTKGGRSLVFSVIVNGDIEGARAVQDRVVRLLAGLGG